MSYGGDFAQSHRRAGIYAGRILKGEKPSDLPVQLVTKVELIINLKAAKTLGLEVSPSLIGGADEVMEYYRASRGAFPDQRNEIHSLRHADDAVIVEFDLLGTHLGEFLGVAPTGSAFRTRMAAIFEFDHDRITCERIYFDAGTILRQLGMT